jgi:hypothetical protein
MSRSNQGVLVTQVRVYCSCRVSASFDVQKAFECEMGTEILRELNDDTAETACELGVSLRNPEDNVDGSVVNVDVVDQEDRKTLCR